MECHSGKYGLHCRHPEGSTYDQWEEDTDQCAQTNRNNRTLSSVFLSKNQSCPLSYSFCIFFGSLSGNMAFIASSLPSFIAVS